MRLLLLLVVLLFDQLKNGGFCLLAFDPKKISCRGVISQLQASLRFDQIPNNELLTELIDQFEVVVFREWFDRDCQ